MQLDPFSSTYACDPATTWRRIPATGHSVTHDLGLDLWLISGHDTVRAVLNDTVRFSNAATLAPTLPISAEAGQVLAAFDAPHVSTTADGAQHTRIRAILRDIFPTTAARAELKWGTIVAGRANQFADHLARSTTADLMQFAVQFPLHVMIDILGLADEHAADLHRWTDAFARLAWSNNSATQLDDAHQLVALWQFCSDVVATRASLGSEYGPGVIGELLRYRDGDDTNLTIPEVAAIVLTIAGAGWETTAGALGHALEHGLTERSRWAQLGHDEHYLTTHVEETMRHSPAIDGWFRMTTTDVELDGVRIPAIARCLLLIGAANHDPAFYTDPHTFNPTRARLGQHLAFGVGPHYCLGAGLARLELTTALRTLARRLPGLALTEGYQHHYKPSAALRQHAEMSASVGARCPVTR